MKSCRQEGMTLIEVLIAGAVFGIFSTMVCQAVVVAFRAQKTSEAKVHALRQGSLMLDHLRRELAVGNKLINPDPVGNNFAFIPTQGDPLLFERNVAPGTAPDGDSTVEVWYWYDPVKKEVRHWQQGEPASGTLEASNVQSFVVTSFAGPDDKNVRITTQLATIRQPLSIVGRMITK
jgi:prepilin-type N-terminal cleavage/methylation domain-containing protein